MCFQATMHFFFWPQLLQSWNYTLSSHGAADRWRREMGAGLTIAAWTDINLFKLMEVSILLRRGGMSSIPGRGFNSNSITTFLRRR